MANKLDQHQMIQALKDIAIELGRTPSIIEFNKRVKNGTMLVYNHFGSYPTFVQAAGLDPVVASKKINNDVFKKDIFKHIENYEPKIIQDPLILEPYPTAAIISDIHWPFVNQKVVNRFLEYVGDSKPEWVIINGDAWDFYSHAKFPRSHNQFTPREEENLARQMNEVFWQEIKKISPKSKCYQLLGNHDVRPMKRILEAYPEAEDWVKEKLHSLFTFNGVTTLYDPREELFLNKNIIVFHGYRSKLGEHRDYTLYSCFNGHTHRQGVSYRQIRGAVLFECNSGLAGDPQAKGLTYTPQKINDWSSGFAALDKLGPRCITI